jgi:hypothetical protein
MRQIIQDLAFMIWKNVKLEKNIDKDSLKLGSSNAQTRMLFFYWMFTNPFTL